MPVWKVLLWKASVCGCTVGYLFESVLGPNQVATGCLCALLKIHTIVLVDQVLVTPFPIEQQSILKLATKLYEQLRGDQSRRAWALLGVPMNRSCVAMALALNERRFSGSGRIDRRYRITGAVSFKIWSFLMSYVDIICFALVRVWLNSISMTVWGNPMIPGLKKTSSQSKLGGWLLSGDVCVLWRFASW